MSGVYEDERPFDYPTGTGEEVFDCDACGDCFVEDELHSVLVAPGTRMQPDEYDNVCDECFDQLEENQ